MKTLPENFVDSRDFARIAGAIRYIDTHFQEQPRLEAIAEEAGLSEFHFNRLFRRWAGVTPKQYLTYVTGSAARAALTAEPSVLDAAHSVGLSGPGRLHDLVVTLDAVTPGELKAFGEGVAISYGFSESPFGTALIAETSRGICHLTFVDPGHEAHALEELRQAWPRARFDQDDMRAHATAMRVWSPSGRDAPLKLAVTGTNFQLKVWKALIALGARERTTYRHLADAVGMSAAARAVGGAVGANRVAWLIPCHHVLRKSGDLGGYRWGEDRKRAMLAWETLGSEAMSPSAANRQTATGRQVPA